MEKKNVEAIYPLTPMQRGLLFHSLQVPDVDPGFLHLRCRLDGPLDPATFKQAWQQAMQRHPALRTVLRWVDLDEPLQIVLRRTEVAWTVEDCRAERPVMQQRRLDAYLAADRERGIDLRDPPAMRLALFRTDETEWHFVWSCHHVLLDGWSGVRVLHEVAALYNALFLDAPATLPPAPPFHSYVRWLKHQSRVEAEGYWRQQLAGMRAPTPLPFAPPDAPNNLLSGHEHQDGELLARTTAALRALSRRYQVTLSTVLHSAWALLLSRHSGHETVTFGTTVSGRSVGLPGIEVMAGLLINSLPIRIKIEHGDTAAGVFRALHAAQADLVRYAHTSLEEVQAWCDVPTHLRLFESLLVVENYPRPSATPGPIAVRDFHGGITSNYPLTLVIEPAEILQLRVIYDRRRFAQDAMTRLIYEFQHLIELIAEAPEQPLGTLMPRVVAEPSATPEATVQQVERGQVVLGGEYVAPRNALERRLTRIWEGVLNVRRIGVHDSFFDLGGQSMQAVQLLNRVERAFGKKLPTALLLGAGSVARMALALRGDAEAPSGASLVPLKSEGARPPLYCIHSYDGQVLIYRHLARHMDPDQPVYGLQAIGLDGTEPPLADVGGMAARYVDEIRSVQPEGPYALAALCFGIAVALEMARLLTEQGQEVSKLFILDSSFNRFRQTSDGGSDHKASTNRLLRILALLRTGRLIERIHQHLAHHGRRLKVAWYRATEGPQEQLIRRVTESNSQAWDNYQPTPYAGAITLLRSSAWSGLDIKRWHIPVWTELAQGGLTTHTVPGNHENMLREPYVQVLASQLQESLDLIAHGEESLPPAGEKEQGPRGHRFVLGATA